MREEHFLKRNAFSDFPRASFAHTLLLRIRQGLILQSCLPIVNCISIGSYFFMEMELINYAPLGFTTHMVSRAA